MSGFARRRDTKDNDAPKVALWYKFSLAGITISSVICTLLLKNNKKVCIQLLYVHIATIVLIILIFAITHIIKDMKFQKEKKEEREEKNRITKLYFRERAIAIRQKTPLK